MGQTTSNNYVINDFDLVKIPKDSKIIKIASYYVDIKNTTNLHIRVDDVLAYFKNRFKNKDIDILCLQGVKDYTSAYTLIRGLKKYCFKKNIHIYLAPAFEEVTIIEKDNSINSSQSISLSISKISKISESRIEITGSNISKRKK